MMTRRLTIALASFAAVALALGASASAAAHRHKPVLAAPVRRGFAFAQVHCAGCHGVTAGALSPNPASPPFEAVVNTPGLTRATLRRFLRNSHNFPDAMNFTVDRAEIDDLARYMLTLRRPGYRPAI
ncbi:MAG: cytochrome c [Novosphingobium sp.]|nr:cytochrome c [Novosphingobium sp.]